MDARDANQPQPEGQPQPDQQPQPAMPFPGQFAFDPLPRFMERTDGQTLSSSSVTNDESSASTSTTGKESAPVSSTSSTASTNPFGDPPLTFVAGQGDLAAVNRWLTKGGIDINQVDGLIGSALMNAAAMGHIEIVKVLVKQEGINLDQTNSFGDSALHLAVFNNSLDVVACLLEAGANVNLENKLTEVTALATAIFSGYIEVTNLLLKRKDIQLNRVNASGGSVLHLAALDNRPDVVARLLKAGAKVNLESTINRSTALGFSAEFGHVEVVKVLLTRKDINPNKRNANGDTALDLALRNKHVQVIEALMEHGAQLPDFDFFATALDPFTIALADLQAEQETPADPQANPLGLADPQSLDQPVAFFSKLVSHIEPDVNLLSWLRGQGIRMACAMPLDACVSSIHHTWSLLPNRGQGINERQNSLHCASAMTMLRVQARKGDAARTYKTAGISAAGAERLSLVPDRQIEFIATLAEKTLARLAGEMLEQMIPVCLAKTTLDYQVDAEALKFSLVDASFLAPVAQAIATSWKSALTTLEAQPIVMPAGLTMKQTVQFVLEHTRQKAPQVFAQAMQRELRSQTLVTAMQTLIGDLENAEVLHTLFQIQCDQLQQYCEPLLKKDRSDAV